MLQSFGKLVLALLSYKCINLGSLKTRGRINFAGLCWKASDTAEQVEDKAGDHLVRKGLSKACFCIGRRGHLGSALTFEDLQKIGCKF